MAFVFSIDIIVPSKDTVFLLGIMSLFYFSLFVAVYEKRTCLSCLFVLLNVCMNKGLVSENPRISSVLCFSCLIFLVQYVRNTSAPLINSPLDQIGYKHCLMMEDL